MAHQLDMSNERANMAYANSAPWHGLGQPLTTDAPLDVWRKEAGMDWTVEKSALLYEAKGQPMNFKERSVLFRSDTLAGLGVVGNDYRVVQPREVMEFFRDLISEHGYRMETAGCLFGGRKFWALASTGKSATILGQDELKPYLLMATSCDGSMATAVHLTSVRVVCNNTLRMAIGSDAQQAEIRIPHSRSFDSGAVKQQLGLVGGAWERFLVNVQSLATFRIDRDLAIQVVADELKADWRTPEGDPMSNDQMLESSLVLRRIFALYDGASLGNDFRSSRGTAWGLLNAVTEHFDHANSTTVADQSRAFERAHLTDRARFKTRIADRLLELV